MKFDIKHWAGEEFWPERVVFDFLFEIAAENAKDAERKMIRDLLKKYIYLARTEGTLPDATHNEVCAVPFIEWAVRTLGLYVPREIFNLLRERNPTQFESRFVGEYLDRLVELEEYKHLYCEIQAELTNHSKKMASLASDARLEEEERHQRIEARLNAVSARMSTEEIAFLLKHPGELKPPGEGRKENADEREARAVEETGTDAGSPYIRDDALAKLMKEAYAALIANNERSQYTDVLREMQKIDAEGDVLDKDSPHKERIAWFDERGEPKSTRIQGFKNRLTRIRKTTPH